MSKVSEQYDRMPPPKFKVGDFVLVHNQKGVFQISHVFPSEMMGKSHRYFYKDTLTDTIFKGVQGYYESVFTPATEADIGG